MTKYKQQSRRQEFTYVTVGLTDSSNEQEWTVDVHSHSFFLLETVTVAAGRIKGITVYDSDHVVGTGMADKHTSLFFEENAEAQPQMLTFQPGVLVENGGRIKVKIADAGQITLIGRATS